MTDLGFEAVDKYEKYLRGKLGALFEPFVKILRDCNAIISGSNVLSVVGDKKFYANDFDIYVKIEDSIPLLKFIMGQDYKIRKKATFGRYCPTFLNKNGIRTIYNYPYYDNPLNHPVDVMVVRNSQSPVDVVKNFDLTFCQVWYDGQKVYATHPLDVKNGTGYLCGDYVEPFLNNNKFLIQL